MWDREAAGRDELRATIVAAARRHAKRVASG
jgi:hypothetical protein